MNYRLLLKKYVTHVINSNMRFAGVSMHLPVSFTAEERAALTAMLDEMTDELVDLPQEVRMRMTRGLDPS